MGRHEMSRHQAKVLKYVKDGNLLKLKYFLCKNRNVQLDFPHGSKQRSVLHLACSIREGDIVSVLLKHGSSVVLKDKNGDTPLHVAARRARKHGRTDYHDLVIPLTTHCPAAMEQPNDAGVTPQHLLSGLRFCQAYSAHSYECHNDKEEDEWQEKLYGAYEDEHYQVFGRYEDDYTDECPDEDFADWADRIRHEYKAKQQKRNWSSRDSCSKSRSESHSDEAERRQLHERLQREHLEYLQRAARKNQETKQGKKRRYEERCAQTFRPNAPLDMLGYDDIPWPAPKGALEEMMAVMLHDVDRSDTSTFRKFLLKQLTLWHPDKFTQRCGHKLKERHRQRIMDTVTALSQELNRLVRSLQ